MFERSRRRDLISKLVITSMIIQVKPEIELASIITKLCGEDTICAFALEHLDGLAHDHLILRAVKNALRRQTRAFVADLADSLEDKVKVIEGKCPICGKRLWAIGDTPFCLRCYEEKRHEAENQDTDESVEGDAGQGTPV
jgi:tRNA(Ile2) C34 agmatinyltransferase TiaS